MGKFFIHIFAFLRKEISEVVRQPRLILVLVFGPFLILLLFGLGYRNEARPVNTLFVITQDSPLANEIESNASTISPQLIYKGVTQNEDEAYRQLVSGQVDMVVIVPNNAYETIRQNQQAQFRIYHNEIDPAQVGYIEYLGQLYVDELNRRVLSSIAQQGQQDAASIQSDVSAARQNAAAMRQALQAGDVEEGRAQQRQMRQRISTVALAVGASAGLLNGVQQNLGDGGNGNGDGSDAANILNLLNAVQESPSNTQDVPDQSDYSQQIRELEQTEADLADLETQLQEFRSVSPQVLTRPFMVETKAINRFQFTPMHFFTPGVITLLLQHITVTIAALSIVRERRAGTVELFRVSPITSGQILIGKYIAYMVFGAFIAAVLGLLLAYGLRVPMFGSWVNFAIVVALLLFSSLGIGFLISLVAGTESQAVQFAMIALLLAVFFSGFLLDLRYLYGAVRVVSWLLPATYGTILLQGIMLRGAGLNLLLLGGLAAIGIVTFIASWLLMRRQMAHE